MPAVRGVLEESVGTGEIFDRLFYRGDVFMVRLGQGWVDAESRAVFADMEEGKMVQLLVDMVEALVESGWGQGFLEYQKRQNVLHVGGGEGVRGIKILALSLN